LLLENLRDRALNNLSDLLAFRHAQKTILPAPFAGELRHDLSADYTALVWLDHGTSVPVRLGQFLAF
jgi:hypothetical protein